MPGFGGLLLLPLSGGIPVPVPPRLTPPALKEPSSPQPERNNILNIVKVIKFFNYLSPKHNRNYLLKINIYANQHVSINNKNYLSLNVHNKHKQKNYNRILSSQRREKGNLKNHKKIQPFD